MAVMSAKIRFGVLSAANIGVKKVIPAMQRGECTTVTAIASRDLARARDAAAKLGIATAYGSYEELLADPAIDAIYNPLPNPLHVPWTVKAAEAGKHVLCEKPLSMTAAEAKSLLAVRERTGVKICEAFMIRSAPQWLRVRELLSQGRIGELRAVNAHFSYFNVNPDNIRNKVETGGGGVYDIGCYCIQAARFGFGREPARVVALVDRDQKLKTNRLASAILDFGPAGSSPGESSSGGSSPDNSGPGHAIFTCSTQTVSYQRVHFIGSRGRIEIEIPFNTFPDRPTRIFIDSTGDLTFSGISTETFPAADQYTLQGDAFARAVRDNTQVPVPLEDSIGNMAVIDAIFRSGKSGQWEAVER